MMNITEIHDATLDQLTDELAAANQASTESCIAEARRSVAMLTHEHQSPDLRDSETNDVIRRATEDETVESVMAGREGHILVDGRRCYVTHA